MIAILAAEPEEMECLLNKLDNVQRLSNFNYHVYEATYKQQKLIVAKTNIGKVNASIVTNDIIFNFSPDLIINTGTAGTINRDLKVGDVVVGQDIIYGDVDVTKFGYKLGQVPRMPASYHSELDYIKKIQQDSKKFNFNICLGVICTTDSFISKTQINKVKTMMKFDVIDMESCAIAQTCFIKNTNFVIIRSVSDEIWNDDNNQQFNKNLVLASQNAAKIVLEVCDAY